MLTILTVLTLLAALAQAAEPITCPDGRPSVYNTQNRGWLKNLEPVDETPGIVQRALQGPLCQVEHVVFAARLRGPGHFYETFGHDFRLQDNFSHSRGGGRLGKLNLRTGEVTVLLEDPLGAIRDPYLSYDAKKLLFSWRKAGTDIHLIYEMNINGTGLTQITDGEGGRFDDVEPIYLPNGEIMFVSGRARRGVPCWTTQVGLCYRCNADGSDVRMVSNGIEHEITPWPLPDGRILYTRWEYVNRSATAFHHLWTFNPDGTAVMTYYGNQHPGFAMTDAKPIPETESVVAIFGSGHGQNEREGYLARINPARGPDSKASAPMIATNYPKDERDPQCWRDPIALGDGMYISAVSDKLYVIDADGNFETLYKLEERFKAEADGRWKPWVHEPRLVRSRRREHVIPDRVDFSGHAGQLVLQDIKASRDERLQGKRIDKLLIIEVLPMAVSMSWTADSAYVTNGSYNIKRILGTVPIAEDGSAYIEVPAMRPVYFIALDEDNNEIKRMNSFTTLMPGETTSCVGCHEQRTRTPRKMSAAVLSSLRGRPRKIERLEHVPESGIFHMPRDIQPIFDKHCASCHNYDKFAGNLVLNDHKGVRHPNSIAFLETIHHNGGRLLNVLQRGHHKVKLSDAERAKIRWWVAVNCQISGTYASFGTGGDECDLPYSHPRGPQGHENPDAVGVSFDESVLMKRCDSCHSKGDRTKSQSYRHRKYTGRGWPRGRNYDHVFNMTEPEKSLLLLAPLSKDAGGMGLCRKGLAKSAVRGRHDTSKMPPAKVFASTDDPDYQALLAELTRMSRYLKQRCTYPHAENWRPVGDYIRAMKLYGVLGEDYDYEKNPLDPFAIDEAYYQLFYDGRTGHEKPIAP